MYLVYLTRFGNPLYPTPPYTSPRKSYNPLILSLCDSRAQSQLLPLHLVRRVRLDFGLLWAHGLSVQVFFSGVSTLTLAQSSLGHGPFDTHTRTRLA